MKNTAGNIFVRFLIFGILALLALIVGVKTLTSHSGSSTLALAAVIFAVNMIVVLGYTLAVIRNKTMLLEEDAPDLAYYLGFSLTVASLAISFISDVGMASTAAANSALVKGSLAQFGAGLLATLIGLCSKIVISSKQAHLSSNPDILYNKFRQEIKGFEDALHHMAASLDTSIKTACLSINASAESAAESMQTLSERLKVSSDSIAEHLTVERIAKPIAAFSDELLKFQDPAKEFRSKMSSLADSTSSVTKGFAALDTTIIAVRQSTLEETKNIDVLVESKKRLNDASKVSINLLEEQNLTVTETNKQLARLKNSSAKTAESYDLVSTSTEKLSTRNGELEAGLVTVNQSMLDTAKKLSELIALTKDLEISLKSSSDSVEAFSVRSSAVNTALAGTSNALTEVNAKFNSVPESLDRTLTSLNLLTGSLTTTSNTTEPLVRSLISVNAPLNETTESAKSLHFAITKLNQDVESLSRIITTRSN